MKVLYPDRIKAWRVKPRRLRQNRSPRTLRSHRMHHQMVLGIGLNPTWLTTRAAMGTADTPAAPIKGLIGIDESRFINLASKTPDAVPMEKAITPRIKDPYCFKIQKLGRQQFTPNPKGRGKIVTALMSAFCMVSESRSTTPHSRASFPQT
ncbi:MAG: hypothetical protein Ct9H90mP9_1360 [Pseudomonadota bacterium]|nr:MAG: hypothetical protein Ct9H90mP9_1360 [Pseudomonadota bacterium]